MTPINWKRLLNPWAVIRQLEDRNLILEDRCSEYWERANEAEDRAFRRASDHYYQRSRMMEEQNKHMMEQLATVSAHQLRPLTVPADRASLLKGGSGDTD